MATVHKKVLKVARAGEPRIVVEVLSHTNGSVRIKGPFMQEVLDDKPSFAKGGHILMTVSRGDYPNAIVSLESYLENLFLKELSNADVHSSSGAGANSGRDEKVNPAGSEKEDSGKGDSPSVHGGSRRKKSTKGSGGGNETAPLDEGSGEEAGG